MTVFVTGQDLANGIRHVMGGGEVRCAVAFWGDASAGLFDHDAAAKARIICDVTMGGTSAGALRDLGAPDNDGLRHLPASTPRSISRIGER